MKKLLDTLFLGGLFMAPKWAIWIILGGCVAAFGETGLGLEPAVYKSAALVGVVLGIISVLYTISVEKKETAAREAAAKAAADATYGNPYQSPPIVVQPPVKAPEVQ